MVALAAFGWMLNDMRLQVRDLAQNADGQLNEVKGLTRKADTVLTQTERVTTQLDNKVPKILEQTERVTAQMDRHLPKILEETENATVSIAEVSANFRQYKDLMAAVHADRQDPKMLTYANSILDLVAARQDAVVGGQKARDRPAAQATGAREGLGQCRAEGRSVSQPVCGLEGGGAAGPDPVQRGPAVVHPPGRKRGAAPAVGLAPGNAPREQGPEVRQAALAAATHSGAGKGRRWNVGIVLFALVWVLNFGISVWNAYAVGKVWVEAAHAGGWRRLMCWAGAVMSACGFTWCYLTFLVLTAIYFGWIDEEVAKVSLNLGYVLLIPFILFAGYAITLDSWGQAYRRGGFLNYGMAAWNTYASIHNTYSAVRNLGGAFASLGDFFKGRGSSRDSDGSRGIVIVLLLVLLALLGGVLTTATIIRRVAATEPLPPPPQDSPEHAAWAKS
jgi:hypothetical protein